MFLYDGTVRTYGSIPRLSLARQFLLTSLVILLMGMLVIGSWVGRQIEIGVVNRVAAVTALYVDSFVSPHLQFLAREDHLGEVHMAALSGLLENTPLGQRIVAFKVWGPDGRILFSTNQNLVGQKFALGPGPTRAFAGEVRSTISDLNEPENLFERGRWNRLIETYAPVRVEGTGSIVAVSEFYQTTDELEIAVRAAQQRSWLIVGASTVVMYLLLAGLVGRASNTILRQEGQLRGKVAQLTQLLDQNNRLHDRVRRSAARTTALHERFLRRISADLHDGPGQDLGLALLRIEALAGVCGHCGVAVDQGHKVRDDFHTIETALRSSLTELRAISAGLRLPEVDRLSIRETAKRAVRDHERKTAASVLLSIDRIPADAPLPVKITLYRLLQESLGNGYRHAGGTSQSVRVWSEKACLRVEVSDSGPGFDAAREAEDGHLGLAVMRERLEILGGSFDVLSSPGRGTKVHAAIPLDAQEAPE